MKKRGDLSLSVSAIVVLILAIVMLGLGLGFIRGMFGKVSTSFEEQIAEEPEAPAPSGAEPITVSRSNLIVHSGDPVALKVGIHNPSMDKWNNTRVNVSCLGIGPEIASNAQFNTKNLTSGESFKGTYLFKVGKIAADKTYLCEIKAQSNGGTDATPYKDIGYSKEITIKVLK